MTVPDNKPTYLEWIFPGLVTVACLFAAILYVTNPVDTRAQDAHQMEFSRQMFNVFLLLAIAASGVWFAYAFTGDPFQRRSEMVRFAYFFVLASLALLSIPPLVKSQAIGTEPIGIVSGCVEHTKVSQLSCIFTDEEERNPARTEAGQGRTAASPAPAGTAQAGANASTGGATGKTGKPPKAGGNRTATPGPDAKPGSGTAVTPANTGGSPYRNQWLVNIGGTLRPQEPDICKDLTTDECKPGSAKNRVFITGGVVVPFPFVIIAMFGGAISLSRRVPEIQKRSEVGYAGTASDPALQPSEVRELLAFQILQFISAPLIAITAHQVLQPESHTTSVALAFMAGFGSEAILAMIRGAFNGIQPKSLTPAAANAGSVGGKVSDAGQAVAGIEVSVTGSALAARTDSNGHYLIHDVPTGGRDLVASEPHRSAKGTVVIVSGHTTVCDLVLTRTGSVKGTVTDAQGRSAAGAKVHVNRVPAVKEVTTGKDGTYIIDAVPVGEQLIEAEGDVGAKKANASAKVTVQYATTASCDLSLA